MNWYCEHCDIHWPHYANYMKCGVCQERCISQANRPPIPVPEAEALITEARADRAAEKLRRELHVEFEKQYQDREAAKFREELDTWLTVKLC